MYSRRTFLLGSLASVTAWSGFLNSVEAFARRGRVGAPAATRGALSLSRQEWPPAIIPDYIGLTAGYCCFSDEFGRLAIVDLRKPGNPKTPVKVVGELSGIGRKVIDFTVFGARAYALAAQQNDPSDPKLTLVTISLAPVAAPSIVSRLLLDKYTEVSTITASAECVCLAGTSTSGENLVTVYQAQARGRNFDPVLLANFSVQLPVAAMDLQDRNLVVLQNMPNSSQCQVEYVNLAYPRTPQTKATIKLEGDYREMARVRSSLLVAGRAFEGGRLSNSCEAKSIILEPSPHAVAHITLDPLTTVLGATAQRDRFMVLGESRGGRCVVPLVLDKAASITRENPVVLPKPKGSYGLKASIVLRDRTVFVASGWAGVEMLTASREGWQPSYTYSIPRLPASGLAAWGNYVVLGSSDLKLYDISDPQRPSLVSTQELPSAVKSIAGAGSYVLCLSKDELALRKMDELTNTVATLKVSGSRLTFDTITQKAFVLSEQEKKTQAHRIKVYSNGMGIEKTTDLPKGVMRLFANGGYLIAGSLNDIYLYGVNENTDLIGSRHFENLAVRDLAMGDEHVLATFVDQQSRGFLLVLSRDQKDLHVLGSVDLPHDGVALAAKGTTAVTVGKSSEGKDLVAIIDFKTPSAPRVTSSMPVVESASAVVIKDRLGIVVGRGLELLSMSS